jgi:hypothetical protein
MEGELVKRVLWSGLHAGLGLVLGLVVDRLATVMWRRAFGEEPPR